MPNAKVSAEQMSFIRCECGFKIPLIFDSEEMGRRIERHALLHKKDEKDSSKAQAVFNRVQDFLIKQVFETASETFSLVIGSER